MTDETIERLKVSFIERCKMNDIKFESKKYIQMQSDYFIGAMIALNQTHHGWGICIMSGRSIITKEEFNN